jgi:trigger factor
VDVTIHSISEVSKEVEISVDATEIQPRFEKAYLEYRPKVELKGFRKGKAPLDLIKKLYGDAIEQETLSTVASELYRTVVKDKELKPIGEPVITDMDYKKGEQFKFKVQYDIRPTVELKEYKGIEIERPVHTVDDAEVEDEISRLRKMNSTTEDATSVTDDEYVVTAQVQELDKTGFPLIGKKSQNARFYLADPELEAPIKDVLKKATRGEQYKVSFQHQHEDHAHDVNMQISVSKVERVLLPEFNDDFVKKITKDKIGTVEEFKKGLREDLTAYWKEKNQRQTINALIAELLRRHDFQVPESLTRSVLQGLLEDIKQQYPKKQLPADFDVEQFAQENRAYAIFQSKWALVREEIITKEGITADEADLLALAEREAPKIGIDKDRLVTYYKSSEQIKDRIIGDKLIEFLLQNSRIKDVEQQNTH